MEAVETTPVALSRKAEKRMKRIQRTKEKKAETKKTGGDALEGPRPTDGSAADAFDAKAHAMRFAQHKAHVLASLRGAGTPSSPGDGGEYTDKSPKGSVDVKCHALMDLLNTREDYITTSSCSGRIALFHRTPVSPPSAQDRRDGGVAPPPATEGEDEEAAESVSARRAKRGGEDALGWLYVKHGVMRAAEMQLLVDWLCGPAAAGTCDARLDSEQRAVWEAREAETVSRAAAAAAADSSSPVRLDDGGEYWAGMFGGEVGGLLVGGDGSGGEGLPAAPPPHRVPSRGTLSLKVEPFVMHVECRTMASAKLLHTVAAGECGYRNSGVVPPGKKIICAIRTAAGCGMDAPVAVDGVSGVAGNRRYLWALLHLANSKQVENERRARLLQSQLCERLREADGRQRIAEEDKVAMVE